MDTAQHMLAVGWSESWLTQVHPCRGHMVVDTRSLAAGDVHAVVTRTLLEIANPRRGALHQSQLHDGNGVIPAVAHPFRWTQQPTRWWHGLPQPPLHCELHIEVGFMGSAHASAAAAASHPVIRSLPNEGRTCYKFEYSDVDPD
jgi:hypothetical protein